MSTGAGATSTAALVMRRLAPTRRLLRMLQQNTGKPGAWTQSSPESILSRARGRDGKEAGEVEGAQHHVADLSTKGGGRSLGFYELCTYTRTDTHS